MSQKEVLGVSSIPCDAEAMDGMIAKHQGTAADRRDMAAMGKRQVLR